jgi:trehalose-6-phosphate synthase
LFHNFPDHVSHDAVAWTSYRRANPGTRISFFLHIPFPGLAGADVIGFHTRGYVQDFLECMARTLHISPQRQELEWEGRRIRIDAYPMGIDYRLIRNVAQWDRCQELMTRTLKDFAGRKLVLFDQLLHNYPEWKGEILLMLLVAPSRSEIPSYQRMVPIPGSPRVLILSEMAAAIHELTDALSVNPYSVDEMVAVMMEGLTMSEEEQRLRNDRMHHKLQGSIIEIDFSQSDRYAYLQFANNLSTCIASIKESAVYIKDPEEVLAKMKKLLNRSDP